MAQQIKRQPSQGLDSELINAARGESKLKRTDAFAQETRPANIDDLAKQYKTPQLVQRFIAENIEYSKQPPYKDVIDKKGEFATFDRIIGGQVGDCSEGAVLAACLLNKLGYETKLLELVPSNGEPGHIVAAYKDGKTGLWGSAGISISDYASASYPSLQEMANELALKCQYTNALANSFEYSDALLSKQPKVTLARKALTAIDLQQEYGVFFNKIDLSEGKAKYDFYADGFKIKLETVLGLETGYGLTLDSAEMNGVRMLEGTITELIVFCEEGMLSIDFQAQIDHKLRLSTSVAIHVDGTVAADVFRYDKSRMSPGYVHMQTFQGSEDLLAGENKVGTLKDIEDLFQLCGLMGKICGLEEIMDYYGYGKLKEQFEKHTGQPENSPSEPSGEGKTEKIKIRLDSIPKKRE